jgi:hypothetical protein
MTAVDADNPLTAAEDEPGFDPGRCLTGSLHVFLAFDWGDEIDLAHATRLVPAQARGLPRRKRTPPSFAYRPPPLRIPLGPVALGLPGLEAAEAAADATVFDFGAASIALRAPFALPAAALLRLADHLAGANPALTAAAGVAATLFERLCPAIRAPLWDEELNEEYYVFQLAPECLPPAERLLRGPPAAWLAGLVRLESGPLSEEETAEALRLHLSYSPDDLLVPDWAAAALIDRDCDETLQVIEFANLQLVEFRHIDRRLDGVLSTAYAIARPARWRGLLWHGHARALGALGALKVDAVSLFERIGNALKLVGDQYLARAYRLVADRLHLREWGDGIERKLGVAESVYQIAADQADARRGEFLELIVIVLILLEIVLAVLRH